MKSGWKQTLSARPELRDLDQWPDIPLNAISREKYIDYRTRLTVISRYLSGASVQSLAEKFGITVQAIYRWLRRALSADANGALYLRRGLVPGFRLARNQRRQPLSTLNAPSGDACAFQSLLCQVEGLKQHLDNHLLALVRDQANGQNLKPGIFHQHFLTYLTIHHWPSHDYPFTTNDRAYESCRQYFHQRLLTLKRLRSNQRVISPRVTEYSPLEEIQLDEQVFDGEAAIGLLVNEQIEWCRISRASLVLKIDRASEYILGAELILERAVDQDDILTVMNKSPLSPETQALNNPNFFQLPPQQQTISTQLAALDHCQTGTVVLDNALCHLAKSVKHYVTQKLSATFNLGLVKCPLRRNLVEYCFHRLNLLFHRFKSTTGSHPKDPVKESLKNRKKAPKVMLHDLEDILKMEIAKYNFMPQTHLQAQSPFDRLQTLLNQTYWPIRSESLKQRQSPYQRTVTLPLHNGAKESRRPYVYFMYARYTVANPITRRTGREEVDVTFDIRDIRRVTVHRQNGEALGEFLASKSWQRFPHSVKTRKRIHKITKEAKRKFNDPFTLYFNYLLEHKDSPSKALELIRISREFSQAVTGPPESTEARSPIRIDVARPKIKRKPKHQWSYRHGPDKS